MPNGRTHEAIGNAAIRLVACGLAPSVVPLLRGGHLDFLAACSMPDKVDEVAVMIPGEGPQTVVLGHNLSSCRHFQVGERGYRWIVDDSLSVAGELVAAAGVVCDAEIVEYHEGLRPPLTGLLTKTPLERALRRQPGFTVGTLLFPSAAEEAEHYAAGARHWLAEPEPNLTAARICAAFATHHGQDTCEPHHGWGVLWYGHAAFEDELEARCHETLTEQVAYVTVQTVTAKAVREELESMQVSAITELCLDNSLWIRRVFGEPRNLDVCPGDMADRIFYRAIATTLRMLELMV